jgi:flagellar hook assembly protein FlgD
MYCNIGPYNLYFDYYGNTGLEEAGSVAVSGIQSSPNPFSDLTSISFNLSQPSPVTLSVYSITGHLVATLAQGETLGSGNHTIQWQGQNQAGTPVSPGVYFCHLRADGIEKTHMMVRVR